MGRITSLDIGAVLDRLWADYSVALARELEKAKARGLTVMTHAEALTRAPATEFLAWAKRSLTKEVPGALKPAAKPANNPKDRRGDGTVDTSGAVRVTRDDDERETGLAPSFRP